MKPRQKITVEAVEKFEMLREKGFNTTEAARITGYGTTTVQFYYRVLKAVHAGEMIPITAFNQPVVEAYCLRHGLAYRPLEKKPSAETQETGAEEQTQIQGIDEQPRGRWHNPIAASDELGRVLANAIGKFCNEFIGEYLKNHGYAGEGAAR